MVLYLVKLQSCILICLKLVEMSFKETFSHFTENCMLYGTLVQVCIHLMSFLEEVCHSKVLFLYQGLFPQVWRLIWLLQTNLSRP